MSPLRFLVDTSALVRYLNNPSALGGWHDVVTAGLVATCPITELELLFTARSGADRARLEKLLRETFGWVVMPERVFEQAITVQAALTDHGCHRSAGPVDLLTAAAAEAHKLVLLHCDRDFVQVAQVTGQPVSWLAAPDAIN